MYLKHNGSNKWYLKYNENNKWYLKYNGKQINGI